MSTQQLFDHMMRNADFLTAAVVRGLRPSEDLISSRQAYEEYGRPWITKNTYPAGQLRPVRCGEAPNSPVKYSRTEIIALKEVEKLQRKEVCDLLKDKD